jgi:phosphomannomutase
MNLSAFKAYDIRGKYPEEVNEELAFLVGRAIARYFKANTITVGRDMRLSSPSLSEKLIQGINYEGADVVNIGMCTTPMLNFSVAKFGFDGGVMISASHNPGGDNAFKIIDRDVMQLSEFDGLNEIKKLVESGMTDININTVKGMGSVSNVKDHYLAHIYELIGGIKPLKVVVDYGNGVGSISASTAFAVLGVDVIELNTLPDGSFPNHPANPHDIANFDQLIEAVKSNKADLGVFFDGDADRSIIVDDRGDIVPVDLLTVLLAEQEAKKGLLGKVYYDLRFSKAVGKMISEFGSEPVMMRVGNPFYKKALREDGGVMGAEFSGHIMYAENYNIDDGLYAALKTIKMVGESDQKLSKMIEKVKIFESSPEESFHCNNPEAALTQIVSAFPESKQINIDGIYLDFEDGFMSVRQSNSERGLIRIRAEAVKQSTLRKRLSVVKSIIDSN